MTKWIKTILFVSVLALLPFLLITFVDVKTGQNSDDIWLKWLTRGLVMVVPVIFYVVNYRHLKDKDIISRILLSLLITVGLTAIWFFLMLTIAVNFMFAIGGHI